MSEFTVKTSLVAFEEDKQAAIVGWCLRDRVFCKQCVDVVQQSWFASPAVGKLFVAVAAVYGRFGRPPSVEEVRTYRPHSLEDGRTQQRLAEKLTEAIAKTEIYGLDLLRSEMTEWMRAVIFSQGIQQAVVNFNAQKVQEAWAVVDEANDLRQTSSFEDGFSQGFDDSMVRLADERSERELTAPQILRYGVRFLDEALGGINPTDVVVIGAAPGKGKTQLVASIAKYNATQGGPDGKGVPVHFFALEAEDREIERRIKFSLLSDEYYSSGGGRFVSYRMWRMCQDGGVLDQFEAEVCEKVGEDGKTKLQRAMGKLKTLYRTSGSFNLRALERNLMKVAGESKLIIVDHLHYIDTEGDNENTEYKRCIKVIRDVALRFRVPVIVVAHLRKTMPSRRAPPLVAPIEDFHGTSDIPKIATACIMIAPKPRDRDPKAKQNLTKSVDGDSKAKAKPKATGLGKAAVEPAKKIPKYFLPTYLRIVKSRIDGSVTRFCASTKYNLRTGLYEGEYELGYLVDGDSEWEPVEREEQPEWASSAVGPEV